MVVHTAMAIDRSANCHENTKKSFCVLMMFANWLRTSDDADFAAQYPANEPKIPPMTPVIDDSM